MENTQQLTEEEKIIREIDFFLRSSGHLFPINDAQVIAYEKQVKDVVPMPHPLPQPETILINGLNYTLIVAPPEINEDASVWFCKAAARNGNSLSPEIMQKMKEDREKDGLDNS